MPSLVAGKPDRTRGSKAMKDNTAKKAKGKPLLPHSERRGGWPPLSFLDLDIANSEWAKVGLVIKGVTTLRSLQRINNDIGQGRSSDFVERLNNPLGEGSLNNHTERYSSAECKCNKDE